MGEIPVFSPREHQKTHSGFQLKLMVTLLHVNNHHQNAWSLKSLTIYLERCKIMLLDHSYYTRSWKKPEFESKVIMVFNHHYQGCQKEVSNRFLIVHIILTKQHFSSDRCDRIRKGRIENSSVGFHKRDGQTQSTLRILKCALIYKSVLGIAPAIFAPVLHLYNIDIVTHVGTSEDNACICLRSEGSRANVEFILFLIRTIFKTTEVGGLPNAHRYGHTTCKICEYSCQS